MKKFKLQAVLSALAVAVVLSIAGPGHAEAAQAAVSKVQVIEPASQGLALQAHYRWHGRTYAYRYQGKYFNHRSHKGSGWSYY